MPLRKAPPAAKISADKHADNQMLMIRRKVKSVAWKRPMKCRKSVIPKWNNDVGMELQFVVMGGDG